MKLPRRRTDPALTAARLPVLGPVEPTTQPVATAAGKIARLQVKAQVKAEKRRLRYAAWVQEQAERNARQTARREAAAHRWQRARQYAPLIGVNACAVVGQVGFFTRHLGLNLPIALMLAAVLESISIYLADVAKETLLAGDSALRLRLASYLLGAVIGGLNYAHYTAHLDRPTGQAVMFGLLSSLSPWLWAIHAKRTNRNRLEKLGQLDRPLVKFSAARWLYHPVRTFRVVRWAAWYSASRSQQDVIAEYEMRRTSGPEIWLSARPARRKRNLLLRVLHRRHAATALAGSPITAQAEVRPEAAIPETAPAATAKTALSASTQAEIALPQKSALTSDVSASGDAGRAGVGAEAPVPVIAEAALPSQVPVEGPPQGREKVARKARSATAKTEAGAEAEEATQPRLKMIRGRKDKAPSERQVRAFAGRFEQQHGRRPTGADVGEQFGRTDSWGRQMLRRLADAESAKGTAGQSG